jgi:hypothetical protein
LDLSQERKKGGREGGRKEGRKEGRTKLIMIMIVIIAATNKSINQSIKERVTTKERDQSTRQFHLILKEGIHLFVLFGNATMSTYTL